MRDDVSGGDGTGAEAYFNPRPSYEGRLNVFGSNAEDVQFQSTPLV